MFRGLIPQYEKNKLQINKQNNQKPQKTRANQKLEIDCILKIGDKFKTRLQKGIHIGREENISGKTSKRDLV